MSSNFYTKLLTERGKVDFKLQTVKFCIPNWCSNSSVVEREENFDPNHWQSELSLEEIREIEENCELVMTALNYTKYSQKENDRLLKQSI